MTLALSQYGAELTFEGVPFTEIYSLHPLAHDQAVASFMKNPPFEIPHIDFYTEMLSLVENNKYELSELPKQLVHHDVIIYNLLSKDNRVHGVLDFDFTSLDIGFMEFAISLNHVIQLTNGSWDMIESFIKGYAQFRKCTYQEINQLQLLTQFYHIAVLHIYIGQHYSGRDIEQNFNYILNQFQTRMDWLNNHSSCMKLLIESCFID